MDSDKRTHFPFWFAGITSRKSFTGAHGRGEALSEYSFKCFDEIIAALLKQNLWCRFKSLRLTGRRGRSQEIYSSHNKAKHKQCHTVSESPLCISVTFSLIMNVGIVSGRLQLRSFQGFSNEMPNQPLAKSSDVGCQSKLINKDVSNVNSQC